jgi:hypothetical protein
VWPPPLLPGSCLKKPSSPRVPDPLAGVVDRLLAQLPGLQSQPPHLVQSAQGRTTWRPAYSSATVATPLREPTVTARGWIGVWGRVLLGLALGVMMAWWPYSRTCGMPLLGYLSATLIVVITGLWAATASWRYRVALAHVVALTVLLYGLTLVVAELLPRTGYAVDHAAWQCAEIPSSLISVPVAS